MDQHDIFDDLPTDDDDEADLTSLLTLVMRFASAVLVLVLTRHAANAIANSLAGNGATAAAAGARGGSRPTTAAASALLGRAASLRAGGDGDEPNPRRVPLLSRLPTSAYGTGDEDGGSARTSSALGYGRSKSMAVPSASGASASSAASPTPLVQFKPLGSAPPLPNGATVGPHYVFLVHGWLGNEQEMSYLGTALEEVVAGRVLSTSTDEDDPNNDAQRDVDEDEDNDGFIHVTANDETDDGNKLNVQASNEEEDSRPDIVVHKPSCNNGRTTDGVAAGGTRLAEEVAEFIVADIRERRRKAENDGKSEPFEEHVTVSFVGNSLGGLYSRYALSLLPSELRVDSVANDGNNNDGQNAPASSGTIILHPNTFCTTATPHLGCSSNTYIPVPRFAERAIGRVLDVTGLDLFRADVDDYPQPQKGDDDDDGKGSKTKNDKENLDNGADADADADDGDGGEARDDEPLLPSTTSKEDDEGEASADGDEKDAAPSRDLIFRMCTEPAYLKPLSSFRRRIAYANAFGTDFQVPTNTAAFLSDKSTYPHRYCNDAEKEGLDFIASVLHTDPSDAIETNASSGDDEDDILIMTRNLDSLGWTKVFIDTRSGIPVPALPKPAFMKKLQRQSTGFDARSELRSFVTQRKSSVVGVSGESPAKGTTEEGQQDDMPIPESLQRRRDQRPEDSETKEEEMEGLLNHDHLSSVTIKLESKELVELMNPSERMHFPLGHTVMVANSKSGFYSKINAKGKPVMNKLAMDLVSQISGFD